MKILLNKAKNVIPFVTRKNLSNKLNLSRNDIVQDNKVFSLNLKYDVQDIRSEHLSPQHIQKQQGWISQCKEIIDRHHTEISATSPSDYFRLHMIRKAAADVLSAKTKE